MSMLTKNEIHDAGIVQGASSPEQPHAPGWRSTTYDATVGTIITKAGKYNADHYLLPPRGIVWVVSKESFHLPANITGITTLRTTWTKKGILTLTAGIVDPGYNGPISTAVINFSKEKFRVGIGDEFFRTAFFQHEETDCEKVEYSTKKYEDEVIDRTGLSSEHFLALDEIADEVIKTALKKPSTAIRIAIWTIVVTSIFAILSLASVPAYHTFEEVISKNDSSEVEAKVASMELSLSQNQESYQLRMEQEFKRVSDLQERIRMLEAGVKSIREESDQ